MTSSHARRRGDEEPVRHATTERPHDEHRRQEIRGLIQKAAGQHRVSHETVDPVAERECNVAATSRGAEGLDGEAREMSIDEFPRSIPLKFWTERADTPIEGAESGVEVLWE